MTASDRTGRIGEAIARKFLEKTGYIILERNWRHGRAEIDLIFKNKEHLIFGEVKTRSSVAFGYPEASVNEKKRRLYSEAAQAYLEALGYEGEIRFDIIAVVLTKKDVDIRHFKDAFWIME